MDRYKRYLICRFKELQVLIDKYQFNWKAFLGLSVSFAIGIMNNFGFFGGVISAVVFGVAVSVLIFGHKKPTRLPPKLNEPIVLELPRFAIWILLYSIPFLLLVAWGALRVNPGPAGTRQAIFFIAFSIFTVFAALTSNTQYVIGGTRILRRTRFPFYKKEVMYDLQQFKSSEVKRFQGLKITFNNGKSTTLGAYAPHLNYLKPYDGKVASPYLEALYKLKQEVDLRAKMLAQLPEEESKLRLIPYKPFGVRHAIQAFLVTSIIITGGTYALHLNSLGKLNSKNPQDLRRADFENAFFTFKGEAFNRLGQKYSELCLLNKDYNCRLSGYIKHIEGDRVASRKLAASSCSNADPHACYNSLLDKDISSTDRAIAEGILSSYCSDEKHATRDTCTRLTGSVPGIGRK